VELCNKAWTYMVETPLLRCDLPRRHGGAHHYVMTDEAKELRESRSPSAATEAVEEERWPL
jgi:hypothetical protein